MLRFPYYKKSTYSSQIAAISWLMKEDYGRAIADFDVALRLRPDNAALLGYRGLARSSSSDNDGAMADFDAAVSLEPANPWILGSRGRHRFHDGQFAAAESDFTAALKLDPKNRYIALWLHLARVRGNHGDGLSELSASVQNDGTGEWPTPIVERFLGRIDLGTLKARAANTDARLQREHACEVSFYLGRLARIAGNKESARELFQESLSSCPKSFVEYRAAKAELKRL